MFIERRELGREMVAGSVRGHSEGSGKGAMKCKECFEAMGKQGLYWLSLSGGR